MNGTVNVKSKVGVGTIFTFTFQITEKKEEIHVNQGVQYFKVGS